MVSSREILILLHANIKSEKQAAHPHSLMSAFVIISLKRVIAKLAIYLSNGMRFPLMWYVRPAKAQTGLRIRAVWSEPLLVA